MDLKLEKNEERVSDEISKPWMTEEEINLLKFYLKKDMVVFEWGGGGSTLEFSKFVKEYYSVEHDFEWYVLLSKKIERNTKLYFVPAETVNLGWFPRFKEGKYNDFKSYVNFIDVLGSLGKKFDVVIVDGRARVDCAIRAQDYLKDNGVIFIHDFEREYYWDVLRYYQIIEIVDKLVVLKKRVNGGEILVDRGEVMERYLMNKIS